MHGAAFGEKSGWERVNWYQANADAGDESLRPRGWAGQHWSPAIGAEHAATREAAALFDETSFAKLEISGPGAAELLERLCDNRVVRGPGKVTYTQMLNRRGGIECDFTVTQLEDERFWIVTGTAFGTHDRAWIAAHAGDGVLVEDVTSRWACIGLWGPRARDILAPCTPDPLDFKYMNARPITVGDVPVRALRVTYVGELGWELYCPMEFGGALWRTLWEAGEPHGVVAGGYRAIDSLRLEKGYRVWGADITPDDTPYEGGLGFAVKLDKDVHRARRARRRLGARPAAVLRRARRPALGRARQRAGAGGRRDLRARDERRLRVHARRLDRLRLPARRARRAGHRGGGRGVRGVDRRRGASRAAVRSRWRTSARLESIRDVDRRYQGPDRGGRPQLPGRGAGAHASSGS